MTSVALHADQALYRVPGGIGTYVREVATGFRSVAPELDVTLFHARFPGISPPSWMRAFPVVELRGGIRVLYPAWSLVGRPPLPSRLAGTNVVHATSPVAIPPPARGQRLVVTVHDLAFLVARSLYPPAWRALFRLGLRRAAARADAVVAVSRHTASDLERLAGICPERIHVVPLAASLPPAPGDASSVLERAGVTTPYVLFVGTIEPRKNVVRLVRAYRRAVADAGMPHALVLAGPAGWGRADLEGELDRGGPGRVAVTGWVSDSELDGLYRGADAFVYPSLYEGFGLPVLEAMARGVPTITARASSLPEVAGDAALLVDPRSVEELASAIARVATSESERERLGAAAAARARAFSWERTARETVSVYRSVL